MAVDLRNTAPSGIRKRLGNGDMQIPVMVRIMEDQFCPAMFPCRVKQPAVRTALVRTFDPLSEGIDGNHLHACGKTPVTSTDQICLWTPEYDGFLEPVKALTESVMPAIHGIRYGFLFHQLTDGLIPGKDRFEYGDCHLGF